MATLQQRLNIASTNRLDLTALFSVQLMCLIEAHSDAIGVPPEFIIYPLLTAVASCMGVNAFIHINSVWREPCILWLVVAAKKGEKKTAALRVVRKPLEKIQAQMVEEWKRDISEEKPKTPPQLLVDNFSFEELHCIMKRNGSQVLGMFDEMSSFYAQLDLFKHTGSDFDKKTLITLNGGGSWTRNFRSYSATIPRTAFNITGFIQPAFVDKMLHSDDPAGFVDRQLFDFPPERDVYLKELKIPVPSDIPNMEDLLRVIMESHKTLQNYTLEGEAFDAFCKCHDQLVDKKRATENEDVQGIYAKARGYVARLAMMIDALEQAIDRVCASDPVSWRTQVSVTSVQAAAAIITHLNTQKLILMGLSDQGEQCAVPIEQLPQYQRLPRLLTLQTSDDCITPSTVSQKHISERVNSGYPVSKAIELMETAAKIGFGSLEETTTPVNNRKIRRLRKRKFEDLAPDAKRVLQSFSITENMYGNNTEE